MSKGLQEFVATEKKKTNCWVCNIPEKQEIEQGFEKGISVSAILRWLKTEKQYDGTVPEKGLATDDKLTNHKRNHWTPS